MTGDRFRSLEALQQNRYLNFYHMDALTDAGNEFDYFFVSRRKEDDIRIYKKDRRPDGVFIYALLKDDPEKLVLIKQYRYPVGGVMYELPAGLVDEGETAEEAAVREMKEETGMRLETVHAKDGLFDNAFFMGQGYTDEACTPVFGYASYEGGMHPEEWESIELFMADKEDVRRILKEESVSVRMALLMLCFLKSDPKDPFAFLRL